MLRSDSPNIEVYRNAWTHGFRVLSAEYARSIDPENHSRWLLDACLITEDGERIKNSDRTGGAGGDNVCSIAGDINPHRPKTLQYITGKTLYLGHFMGHYGHFISEFLSRCWPLMNGVQFDKIAVFPFIFERRKVIFKPWQREILRAFDLDINSFIPIYEAMSFEEIIVPEQLFLYQVSGHQVMRDIYCYIKNKIVASDHSFFRARKIFLSRGAQLVQRRNNRHTIEKQFQEDDFFVVYPEFLDIQLQLSLYNNSTVLAGFPGSAMHNIVFCSPGTELVEVCIENGPKSFSPTQNICNGIAHAKATRLYIPE